MISPTTAAGLNRQLKRLSVTAVLGLACLGGLIAAPTWAQSARFDSLTLSAEADSSDARGTVMGRYQLANIANRDRNGTLCLGYGAEAPSHLLVLDQDVETLTLQVDSGGNDTTLLVQGPNNTVYCGDTTSRRNPDAQIQGENWPAGTYQVWVGAYDLGERHNYTLRISQP